MKSANPKANPRCRFRFSFESFPTLFLTALLVVPEAETKNQLLMCGFSYAWGSDYGTQWMSDSKPIVPATDPIFHE